MPRPLGITLPEVSAGAGAVGREAVLDAFVRRGVINFSSFERAIEYLRIDGDWAIIMGAETVTAIGDAPLSGQIVQRWFTNVWNKEAGTSRLFTRHANNAPRPL